MTQSNRDICDEPNDITDEFTHLAVPADEPTLLAWLKQYLPHYAHDGWSRMHLELGQRLEELHSANERGWRLNILAPRGSAKSTLITLGYVLREAVSNREKYIWIVSDTNAQSSTHLRHIKEELEDEENAALWGDYGQAVGRGKLWRLDSIRLNNGVRIEAFGTGQSVRGRRNRQHRPSLIICDDIQGDKHIASPLERARSRRWFHGGLLKAGEKRTNVINLATALHREALAMELGRTPGWEHRLYQSIQNWPTDMQKWEEWQAILASVENPHARREAREFYGAHQAEMDEGALVLWPAREDLYDLMTMRAESGRAAFEREKQNIPHDPSLCEWPPEYFQGLATFQHWPQELRVKVLALDPSGAGGTGRHDYSAYVVAGLDFAGMWHVDATLLKRGMPEVVAVGMELVREHQPHLVGIESNTFQGLVGPMLLEEYRKLGQLPPPIEAVENKESKFLRIRRLGSLLAQRLLRFKQNSPGVQLLLQQLQDFPGGEHDDGPDALEMAYRLASESLRKEKPYESVVGVLRVP